MIYKDIQLLFAFYFVAKIEWLEIACHFLFELTTFCEEVIALRERKYSLKITLLCLKSDIRIVKINYSLGYIPTRSFLVLILPFASWFAPVTNKSR